MSDPANTSVAAQSVPAGRAQDYHAEPRDLHRRAPAGSEPPSILDQEHDFIEQRRRLLAEAHRNDDLQRNAGPDRTLDGRFGNLTGLAYSGGGIRSATFCLGVAQALNRYGLIDRLDYLSTVSGGGYFGTSLVTTLHKSGGGFVYEGGWDTLAEKSYQELKAKAGGAEPDPAAVAQAATRAQAQTRRQGRVGHASGQPQMSSADLKDSRAVGHLRNYSNYLIPKGLPDLLQSAAIVVRGLAANAALVLWVPLILAAVTSCSNPTRGSLDTSDLFGQTIPWPPVDSFAVTLTVLLLSFLAFYGWALVRSWRSKVSDPDIGKWYTHVAGWILVGLALTAFFEFQPFAIKLLFSAADQAPPAQLTAGQKFMAWLGVSPAPETGPPQKSFLTWIGLFLTPLMAAATFFRETLKSWLADTYFSKTYAAILARGTALAILWGGALALPLLIWILYVHLSYWAIADIGVAELGQDKIASLPAVAAYCAGEAANCFAHSPAWFSTMKDFTPSHPWAPYFLIALVLFAATWPLKPNAYSLHHLYRDRLSKAFLFDPMTLKEKQDPQPCTLKLHELADAYAAPYLLVNTAINVQSSTEANRRGRNAEFFLFSPRFIGSRVTGYIETKRYFDEDADRSEQAVSFRDPYPDLDLGTVMAISGAAASSNMGARTIRVLAPTLALLNVRLGYWLKNPLYFLDRAKKTKLRNNSLFFLTAEMAGSMKETDRRVYLTDGGHIENLGIYELLRRRCKLIIAVDAEADPQMRFGSFITLQIYARIDLGNRIDLPIEAVREATLAAMKADAEAVKMDDKKTEKAADAVSGKKKPAPAPPTPVHVAVGRIDYGDDQFGTLVYIKASLTGDENDYVRDYSRRNPTFPHESTGDQFFTEEQFEVYRALGFHIADRFLSGKDPAIVAQDSGSARLKIDDPDDKLMVGLRNSLGL